MSRKLIFTLLYTLSAIAVHAQQRWTLEECIDYGKENNIQIKQAELGNQNSAIELNQAKMNFIPSVGVNGGYNVSYGRVLDPTTYEFLENNLAGNFNSSVVLSSELFGGLKNIYAKQRAELNRNFTFLNIDKAKNDLTVNILSGYLQILLVEENIKIAQNEITIRETQLKLTQKKVKSGKSTIGDLLQIQASLSEAQTNLLSVKKQHEIAKLELCQLLEIENYADFTIETPDEDVLNGSILSLDNEEIAQISDTRPEIKSRELQVDMASKDIKLSKAAMYPTLGLNVGYGSTYSDVRKKLIYGNTPDPYEANYPFREQFRDNSSAYLSLNLNIPIFNSSFARNGIKRSKVALSSAEYDLLIAKKQLSKEIKQALINVETSYQSYVQSIDNVETNKESFRHIEKKLDVGAATFSDYDTALNNLVNAQSQQQYAKYEYIFNTKIIDFYENKPIRLNYKQ